MLDGGRPSIFHDSPFYDAYLCADGRYVTIGALEPQFYALLIEKLGLADVDPKAQYDTRQWPALKARFRDLFLSRPSAEWRALLEGTDVCFAPVLTSPKRRPIRTMRRAASIARTPTGGSRRPRRRAFDRSNG